MAEDENDTLGVNDFLGRQARGYQSGIRVPQFQANNFEIKQTMLKMIELQGQFAGNIDEDPNRHLIQFLDVCNSFKQNGVPNDVIRLRLFPYSLQGKAKDWLNNLEEGSVSSWDQLEEKFRSRFFPHNKMVDARAKIVNFQQQFGEHLYEAWERFKLLVRRSPGHNQEKWVLLQIFSSRLTPESKSELNAVTNGGITKQPVNHVWNCLDDLAADYIQNNNERRPVKVLEKVADDSSSQIVAMLSAINKRFDRLEARVDQVNGGQMGVHAVYAPCDYCGEGHVTGQCRLSQQIEPVNYAGDFRTNNQHNPYSNTYNPGWRNNPNFSWKHGPTLNQASTSGVKQVSPPGLPQLERQPIHIQEPKVDLEEMMTKLMAAQIKNNQEQANINSRLESSIRNLEVQVGQIATEVNALQQRGLPSTTVPNPQKDRLEECKAMTLRSGKQLPNISPSTSKSQSKLAIDQTTIEVPSDPSIELVPAKNKDEGKGRKEKGKTIERPKYVPPLPFPQRFQKQVEDRQYSKFLEIFKQLHINIPFSEALEHMPKWAKFLKDMLCKKKRVKEYATVALTQETTSVIKPQFPLKCKDPGSFSIPCSIGENFKGRALCDSGSSVNLMPLSVFKKLNLGEAKYTTVTLQMADRSLSRPFGIIEDVLVRVESFVYPVDFIILDIEEDKDIPLIVGRPFIATARALVDGEKGTVVLRLGDEQITFNANNAMKHPNGIEPCAKTIVNNEIIEDKLESCVIKDPSLEKHVVAGYEKIENLNEEAGRVSKASGQGLKHHLGGDTKKLKTTTDLMDPP